MNIRRLRNKLLLGAVVISVLTALAYMLAVSWVIRGQYLDQSKAALQKASHTIADHLAERQAAMLSASRQLARQGNLGATLWYLQQYARSDLDRETLASTYQQLARETGKTGHIANVARIAIYNASGELVTFALLDDNLQRVGFVERDQSARLRLATVKAGEEINADNLHAAAAGTPVPGALALPLAGREYARFALDDSGKVAIETAVPILDVAPDGNGGQPASKQVGLVVMVQALDQAMVSQLGRLTDTQVNVFSARGLSSGALAAYRHADWQGAAPPGGEQQAVFNEIAVDNANYYQALMPLYGERQAVGSIAALRAKSAVENNIAQTVLILALIAAASLAFVVPFAWYFATSISRPLTTLSRIFRGVASGARTAPLPAELQMLEREKLRHGELADLTRSFLAMNDAVNQKMKQIHEINATLEHTIGERTAALVAREAESRTLIENSPDSIARYDSQCRRIYANPAFCAMAGCALDELLGKRPLESPGGPHAALYEGKIREVFETGANTHFELKWGGADGEEYCSHVRLTAETGPSGEVETVLAVGRDITDRMAFETMIWRQANFDALTNLPNRQMFQDRLQHDARLSQRYGRPMALMLIDLDRFKEINDSLGHDMGDVLLLEAAQRITSCVRSADTVARIGGDEFTVILPSLEDPACIERIAQAINCTLAEPFVLGGEDAFISASIGITLFPADAAELDVLFKNADQAMYAAKGQGRNRYSYFTPDLQEAAQKRLRLTSDLRAALAGEQFMVYYQPIVELPNGRIHKAEALLRWRHPERGIVCPQDFIPLAEETGLIVPIGDWVFRQAVQQVRRWRERFDGAFQISVNKSPVQIRHDTINGMPWPDYMAQQGLPGQAIATEITEGLLLNAEPKVNERLLALRDAGIQVAIDDFGTGYSSLAYLKRFDIDYLKIDRSFVHNLGSDSDDAALCEAIIVMAHKLELKVIAEGVETAAQRDFLAAAGCDYAQGYLYARPMPPEQFEQWAWSATERAAEAGFAPP